MKRFNPSELEPKWQRIWEEQHTYRAQNNTSKQPYYALSFFPYPSGAGLHIGHVRNFTITDVAARYKRMQGYEVLHPMGWDSFGLPGENYAIKTGVAPQITTKQNTDNFRAQAKHLGLSIDWSREFGSSDPDYYKWTQWFFLMLLRRGLAYQKESLQFWCNECKTVLANEQVVNGCCWRHEDLPVVKKSMTQWFFKITDYAARLESDLADIDWPESIKTMQRNWIGRSKGAEITFAIEDSVVKINVFTTRADTLFGATFVVLAPEHPLAQQITLPEYQAALQAYVRDVQTKTEIDRMDENREKTGVFTGAYAINPINGARLPVWVADYVLMGYGTGAIMAVPAHDDRDHAFAEKYDIPIVSVVEPETGTPQQQAEFRRSIVAVVRNPKTNEFLSINWGKLGGNLFIGGGRDGEESLQATAQREISEETGYTNLRFVAQTGPIHHHYFAASKNVARRIEAHGLLFDLVDESRQDTALEADEKDKFTVEWLPQSEVEQKIADELHHTAYRLLVKNECYHGEGRLAHSGKYNGLATNEAREKIIADLTAQGVAQEKINFKLRDWLISRQRYWGAPIPVIHCQKDGAVPVPEADLPVRLPEMENFQPTGDGRSPLAKNRQWVEVDCPKCGAKAERETDTMDGFACSSWYALRFADPHNANEPFSRKLVEKWAPVDMYVGGAEHAVMHLLYARMWTKVMYDEGLLSFHEPFKALRNQGMLVAPDGQKFSKSKGNGVDPEEVINSGYGADALRTTMMFLAPFDQKTPWSPESLGGVYRFLNRIWTLAQELQESAGQAAMVSSDDTPLIRAVHKTVKRVTADFEVFGYNTAIAAQMELVNTLYKLRQDVPMTAYWQSWQWALRTLAQLVAPFAPHMAEELWLQLGGEGSVHVSAWPSYDESLTIEDMMKIVVQVNGKLRSTLHIVPGSSKEDIEGAALSDVDVQKYLNGKPPARIIHVPGRLVNFVVK